MRYQQETPRPEEDASADLKVRATYTKKSDFAPHVTIAEETFFGHGWQPLTIAFAQALWFLPPNRAFDVPFLVKWLEQLGWKGANGKPVGANVVRRELGLLREAGYLQTHRLRGEGGKAVGIQYVVSQRRTDQPETGSWIPAPDDYRSSGHVPPMTTRGQSPHVADGEKPSSDHMPPMATRVQLPHVVDGSKPQVNPRGINGLHPPHPPEEEDSSSPTPPSRPAVSLPSQREEGSEFSPEEITAAVDFLQQMQQWQAGAATARSCAPKLLRTMREQGWPSLAGADPGYLALLEAEVLKNTRGATSWTKCLPGWVRDLRRYALVRSQTAPPSNHPQPTAARSLIKACSACDEYGWLLDDDDSGPQRRCTHPGVTRSEAEAAK
ncbi:hypothetical protein RFN57_03610 [Streptomyces violaceochromogenes]|uniref:Helix-turn-helix domain-containing protein n=1 Tax=Streptomyces violaceochromogenes TaxID=67377 RepID=A0ABU6LPS5_9ACTN|nr:hypothetical protein [Streptomyces violaceochromogenes]MEC7051393.1 hypothetical protein [Streptomyces violaceochromogenes]